MEIEKVLGVEIFKWKEYDILEEDYAQFYNVEFILPELEEFNTDDTIAVLGRQGDLQIYIGEKVVKELNIASLKSFRDKLNSQYGS
ncbi:hypothetical protein FKN04_12705 [Bacillus glycinifermentans]|uniref:hypothetical protein n=1 Tax=Bacillus glycinifermentans TaxID=1664069 RepID=UPI001583490F|nr:hypothetical protein [Bacillus glycinifermentans]NUJ17436.1 hypothetical protein [Bacillus glycinifermentans]